MSRPAPFIRRVLRSPQPGVWKWMKIDTYCLRHNDVVFHLSFTDYSYLPYSPFYNFCMTRNSIMCWCAIKRYSLARSCRTVYMYFATLIFKLSHNLSQTQGQSSPTRHFPAVPGTQDRTDNVVMYLIVIYLMHNYKVSFANRLSACALHAIFSFVFCRVGFLLFCLCCVCVCVWFVCFLCMDPSGLFKIGLNE